VKGVRYVSSSGNSGYAVAGRSYVRALVEAGLELTWTPMKVWPHGDEMDEEYDGDCEVLASVHNRPLDYDTAILHLVPEYYPAWIDRERSAGRRVFGYTVWELAKLPEHWPVVLNRLDGLFVPCRWNARVFRESGVTVPIHVVPHLSQFENSPPSSAAQRLALMERLGTGADTTGTRPAPFVFYTVGFWSNRKAPNLVLEAYWRAFSADDPVFMIVKTSDQDITRTHRPWRGGFRLRHPSTGESARRLAAAHRNPARWVVIEGETLSDPEMRTLHDLGDCFVSLTRCEGWGLGAYEAARLGKPVVMTGYGGQRDYLPDDLSWPVSYEMVPVHEPGWSGSYVDVQRWADPSLDEAARHMREIHSDPVAAGARGARLADHIRREFRKQDIVGAMLSALG